MDYRSFLHIFYGRYRSYSGTYTYSSLSIKTQRLFSSMSLLITLKSHSQLDL